MDHFLSVMNQAQFLSKQIIAQEINVMYNNAVQKVSSILSGSISLDLDLSIYNLVICSLMSLMHLTTTKLEK